MGTDADAATAGRGLLILDFDGTLYRGDEPVLAYLDAMCALAPASRRRWLRDAVLGYLDSGTAPDGTARLPEDGWDAVDLLATGVVRDPRLRHAAFEAARARLVTGRLQTEVPDGLAEALTVLRSAGHRVVLASNSPADSVLPVLRTLGLSTAFDDIVAGAGKPAGLREMIAADRSRHLVISVGDHHPNDIAPAAASGALTGYLNPRGLPDRPATAVAARMEELLPQVVSWIDGADPAQSRVAPEGGPG